MAEISVYSFQDHRQFLKETFGARKSANSSLTMGKFSLFLGFGSANYLRLILDGKRNLTLENILGVANALGLLPSEIEFFEALTQINQTTSDSIKRYYRARLNKLKATNPITSARLPTKQLLTQWYFPVVLLFLDGLPRLGAVEHIRKKLPISESAIQDIIAKSVKQNLLKASGSNYELDYNHQIFYDVQAKGAKHRQFLNEQLALSKRMLDRCYEKGAKFYAHTFTISEPHFAVCENRLRELLSDLTALSNEDQVDHVAQLNIQFFKITKDSI